MHLLFVDVQPAAAGPAQGDPPFGRGPRGVASPTLLCRAAAAQAAGDAVSYLQLDEEALRGEATRERLCGADRVVLGGPRAVGAAPPDLGVPVEVYDPWRQPVPQGLPPYALAAGQSVGHAEADVAPAHEPAHPWAWPSVSTLAPEEAERRTAAAAAALPPGAEAPLYLSDERVPLTMDRLRALGELSRSALERRTFVQLHLRAWPADLLAEHLLDNLALLPLASLDLLAGSLRDQTLERFGCPLRAADLQRCAAEVLRSGLAHLSRLSLVLGLPGESADDCVVTINEAFRLALTQRIPRLRFSFWFGEGPPPLPPERGQRFLAAHPGWHEVEYRGVQDYIALTAMANPQLVVVGPEG